MSTMLRDYPLAKGKMSVSAVQWLPGALSSMLPFFAVLNDDPHTLRLRADDPNIYGVYTAGLMNTPVVEKAGVKKNANKGFNFYSAPWCISPLPARDVGKRTEITDVDPAIYDYITALYSLIGVTGITLTDWRFEQTGFAKCYQVLQGSSYVNVGNATYFGAAQAPNSQISGVSTTSAIQTPLISNDFTFNGSNVTAYQLPYNTFYVVDTPIVISAVDSSNPQTPRIYFTLLNNVTLFNGPNYNA
jgi:hypothetical protein